MRAMTFLLLILVIMAGIVLYLLYTGQLTDLIGFDWPDWEYDWPEPPDIGWP